jgi:hypothetical protein
VDKCGNYKPTKVNARAIYWQIFESKLSTKIFASFFRDVFEYLIFQFEKIPEEGSKNFSRKL